MKFEEAVKAMKEGKKVSCILSEQTIIIYLDGDTFKNGKDNDQFILYQQHIEANWQIVEEKKTLSDKMHTIEISGLKSCFDGKEINGIRVLSDWIDSTEVKDFIRNIKELIKQVDLAKKEPFNTTTVWHCIDKIAGKRLI